MVRYFSHLKSGVIFFANDEPKVKQFFIPSLGPAPKWCSHLESITEELETMKPTGKA
jgi:ribosome biogenesis protein ENP2